MTLPLELENNWWAAMDVNYKWKDTSKYILNAKIKPAVKVFLTKLFNHRVYNNGKVCTSKTIPL